MARPKIYDENHFRLGVYTKEGRTYLYGYRNEWDPVKKRSKVAKRIYVGTFNEKTGRAKLGKKFLSNHPEYEGKTLYYRDHELVEEAPVSEEIFEDAAAEEEVVEHSNDISVGATWACWETAKKTGILKDLTEVFGPQLGPKLLHLAIYQYLEGNAMSCFEDWSPDVWLPDSRPLSGQRISECLGKVQRSHITEYMKKRYDRVLKRQSQNEEEKTKESSEAHPLSEFERLGYRFLAVDSTGISTYSSTIEHASFGHAKQNPELRQINFTLGVDYLSGDVCYAYECDGSINDKTLYPHLLADMKNHGFDLEKTVLVTDRGYQSLINIQKMLNAELKFIAGVPLIEKGIKTKFSKYQESLRDVAFYNEDLDVYSRGFKESWIVDLPAGEYAEKINLFLYSDSQIAQNRFRDLNKRIGLVLRLKNEGKKVEPEDWKRVSPYIQENKEGKWEKNLKAIREWETTAGGFAIRTNALNDPFETLSIYRQRNIVETAFRHFKVANEGARLHCTEGTFIGKFLVHVIAQSLRMSHLLTAKRREQETKKLPSNSLDKAMGILKRIRAIKGKGKVYWYCDPLTKKARDILELLDLRTPPKQFKSI